MSFSAPKYNNATLTIIFQAREHLTDHFGLSNCVDFFSLGFHVSQEDQYPETLSICSISQWKQNWKCVLLTCLIFSCLLSVLLCHRQISNQVAINQENSSNKNMRWMLICCSIILYSLYLMECSYATDKIQLCTQNITNIEQIKEKINKMKNSDPVIWWKATCYHYARRKRRTTQYRRGTYFVSTKVYQERVNSFTSSSSFNFSCCGVKDISNNLILDQSSGPIIKFRFSKGFAFANMASAVEFEEQRSMFFRELRRYDDYMEIHEGLDLTDCPVFEEEIVALNTTGERPWFANPFYYWLYSCFLLSWPYRLVLSYNTAHVHYKITKLFGTNYTNLSDSAQHLALLQLYGSYSVDENDETPVWSEIATLDESTNDVNRITSALVPSYSEALLLDDHQALIPETQSVRDVSLDDLTNNKDTIWSQRRRSRYASAGVLQTQFNESTDSDIVQPFLPETSVDNPPTYEEALMFPIVEHPAVGHLRQSEAEMTNSPSNQTNLQSPSHAQNETRLPNSRTFLSIETSL